ncbi:MAG: cytochrome c oxidase subunit II [Gammaproteobacteria bacterium]|nr:cytochrome c oxidase subunit II [Gammaproteobacteria bacterium]
MFSVKTFRALVALGVLSGLAFSAQAGWFDLNLPQGVTPISKQAYSLHMLILWICVAIGVVVFGAMFISMYSHRKSLGVEPAHFHHSTFAEIMWTAIPFLILVVMAVPATKALVMMEDSSEAEMTVKVTGYQWKWRYDYIEDNVSFYSNLAPASRNVIFQKDLEANNAARPEDYLLNVDREVVLPTKTKVRLLLTSDDVIHAWWVPMLGQKKDAIPGYINTIWTYIEEPGVYRGQCAELCGKDHGFMPIVVNAVPADDYKAWVDEQHEAKRAAALAEQEALNRDWALDELMSKGKEIYAANCAGCHQLDGKGQPPTFPAIAGSKIATGPKDAHVQLVVYGSQKNTMMAAFGPSLNNLEIAAVLTYQRNSFGNSTGDVVQPKDVKAAR